MSMFRISYILTKCPCIWMPVQQLPVLAVCGCKYASSQIGDEREYHRVENQHIGNSYDADKARRRKQNRFPQNTLQCQSYPSNSTPRSPYTTLEDVHQLFFCSLVDRVFRIYFYELVSSHFLIGVRVIVRSAELGSKAYVDANDIVCVVVLASRNTFHVVAEGFVERTVSSGSL